mmetsp:Transcript_139308/g.347294  ORF Transcript_139308/g.347294 Transcript_139308/m.347294 type:complete len:254 (+) Transcript_139308:3002-3763(+)
MHLRNLAMRPLLLQPLVRPLVRPVVRPLVKERMRLKLVRRKTMVRKMKRMAAMRMRWMGTERVKMMMRKRTRIRPRTSKWKPRGVKSTSVGKSMNLLVCSSRKRKTLGMRSRPSRRRSVRSSNSCSSRPRLRRRMLKWSRARMVMRLHKALPQVFGGAASRMAMLCGTCVRDCCCTSCFVQRQSKVASSMKRGSRDPSWSFCQVGRRSSRSWSACNRHHRLRACGCSPCIQPWPRRTSRRSSSILRRERRKSF